MTNEFLGSRGEMSSLIQEYGWEATPVGAIPKWSASLRAHMGMMLNSRFPMLIFWGKELITFYNDAFRPSLGSNGKHPSSLGQKGEQSWAESWPVIGPMIYTIMAGGGAVWFEDQKLPLYRDGKMGYAYWTYSFSPLNDDDGKVAGVLVTCAETTKAVESIQELAAAKEQHEMAIEAAELGTFDFNPATGQFSANSRLKEWFGLQPDEGIELSLALDVIMEADRERVTASINQAMMPGLGGRYEEEYHIIHPKTGHDRIVQAKGQVQFGPSGEAVRLNGTLRDITQQVQKQQQKQKDQSRLLSLFEQSPIGIAIIVKENLTFTMANPFYGILVDRRPEEIIGKPLLNALPEIAGQGFDDLLNRVIETGEPFIAPAVPVQIKRGDSIQTIYVDLAYQPMQEENGSISGVLVIATDVTQATLSRKNIEASEAKFRSLIEEAPFATALYAGADLIVDIANDAMIDLWGKTRAVIGQPLIKALPELEGQPFIHLLQEVRQTGQPYVTKEQSADLIVGGRLQRFWFNFTYKPLFDEEGKVYAILNMAVDVSEQINSRKRLEVAQADLSAAIDLAEMATWSINLSTKAIEGSERFREWIGVKTGPIHLEESLSVVPPEFRESIIKAIQETVQGKQRLYDMEHPLISQQTGQRRIIHARGQVRYDTDGSPISLTGSALDITAQREQQLTLEYEVQKRTEQLATAAEELQATNEELGEVNNRLSQSNEELTQYAYVASHDLQEPLRKIRLFSSRLSDFKALQPEVKETLSKIQRSADRMSLLIKDLLEFSRLINSDSFLQQVSLPSVIKEIKNDFELVIAEKAAHIIVGPLPVIEGVRLQMNQLFYNLIGNALKFTSPQRDAFIEIQSRPATEAEVKEQLEWVMPAATDYYLITIKDNGIGFDQKYAEQIFEVFKRLHDRSAYEGSGIGLALCRRIVQNHNGKLYAESQPGKGTTFFILLPVRQPHGFIKGVKN